MQRISLSLSSIYEIVALIKIPMNGRKRICKIKEEKQVVKVLLISKKMIFKLKNVKRTKIKPRKK